MKRTKKVAPPARIGRPPADEAEKLGDRLLDAAASQFLEKGYARATMDGIARAANASTKTIYNRYANKGDILAAVIRRLVETTVANLQSGMDGLRPHTEARAFLLKVGTRSATLVTSAKPSASIASSSRKPDNFPNSPRSSWKAPDVPSASFARNWKAGGAKRRSGRCPSRHSPRRSSMT